MPFNCQDGREEVWGERESGRAQLLASDLVGDVGKKYGVYKEEENVSFRALFLLDPQGRILVVEKCDFPVGCTMKEPLRLLEVAIGSGELEMELEEELAMEEELGMEME